MPVSGLDVVRESVVRMEDQIWSSRESTYAELEDWYIGGRNVARYLVQFPGEEWDEYADRARRLEVPNYVSRLADAIIDGAYGDPVKRTLGGATEEQQELFDSILDWNNYTVLQRTIASSMIVLGDGWANVAGRLDEYGDQTVAIFEVHPANVYVEWDPNYPRVPARLTERRLAQGTKRDPLDRFTYWQWTASEYWHVRSDHTVLEYGANPYGRIPYVRWPGRLVIGEADGLSYIRDQITTQKMLLNKLSELDLLSREQSHGLLVMSGYDDVKMDHGPRRALKINQGGDAKYIQPGAAIGDLRQLVVDAIERMCDTGSVPMSILRGGTASSGLQLAIELRPFTRLVASVRASSVASEVALMRMVCDVGRAHGLPLPAGNEITPSVEWYDNVLPSDQREAFARDLAMVNNVPPLMTREDFVRRWIDRVNTDEEVAEYLASLDAQSSQRSGVGSDLEAAFGEDVGGEVLA